MPDPLIEPASPACGVTPRAGDAGMPVIGRFGQATDARSEPIRSDRLLRCRLSPGWWDIRWGGAEQGSRDRLPEPGEPRECRYTPCRPNHPCAVGSIRLPSSRLRSAGAGGMRESDGRGGDGDWGRVEKRYILGTGCLCRSMPRPDLARPDDRHCDPSRSAQTDELPAVGFNPETQPRSTTTRMPGPRRPVPVVGG